MPQASPTDYLAAERTFLAWIRTGVALMGFGFVVARFNLFLRTLAVGQPQIALQTHGSLNWVGAALVMLGVVVTALSGVVHIRQIKALDHDPSQLKGVSTLGVAVACVLALIGCAMAFYVIPKH